MCDRQSAWSERAGFSGSACVRRERRSATAAQRADATMATPLLADLAHVHVSDRDLGLLNHMVHELPVRGFVALIGWD